MTKIPEIRYQSAKSAIEGFDLFQLDSLYRSAPAMKFDLFSPHRVHFNLLLYIEKGSGEHLIDYKQHAYSNGSFLFVNREQVHAFDRSARLQGVGLVLTRSFVESIRSNIRQPVLSTEFALRSEHPVLNVEPSLKTSCQNLLTEIADVSGGGDHDSLMVQLLLVSLLLKLRLEQPSQYSSLLSERRLQQYAQFITLVNDNFVAIKDANQYAHMMGLTYKSLNQLCKLASNQTPKRLIDECVALEAKRQLSIERMQVAELAYELGFDEATNFVKFFKRITGTTPSQFKQAVKKGSDLEG